MGAAKDDVVRGGKVLALEESQTRRAIQSLMAEKDQTEKAEEVAGWRAVGAGREGVLPVGHGGRREVGVAASHPLPTRLRLSKKVLMERERRRGLAALFDALEAATWPQLPQERRGRSSYGERVRAARACIAELEKAVGRREEEWGREVARRAILTRRLHTLAVGEGEGVRARVKAPKLYTCPVGCGASQAGHREAFLHQVRRGLASPSPRRATPGAAGACSPSPPCPPGAGLDRWAGGAEREGSGGQGGPGGSFRRRQGL